MRVAIETESALCMGRTVIDPYPTASTAANALVLETADADGIYQLLLERLATL